MGLPGANEEEEATSQPVSELCLSPPPSTMGVPSSLWEVKFHWVERKALRNPRRWQRLRGQVQYLHKALLPQLDGVGGLEEVRAEVEAQLEGEAVHVDALHLFLWEMGGGLGQSGRHSAREVRGGSRSHGPELLPDLHHHLKPPPHPKLRFKNLLCTRPV